MKERIGIAIRTMAVFSVFAIALLLLTNTVNAEIPVSDGFDYPVGWPEGTDYAHGQQPGGDDGWDFFQLFFQIIFKLFSFFKTKSAFFEVDLISSNFG